MNVMLHTTFKFIPFRRVLIVAEGAYYHLYVRPSVSIYQRGSQWAGLS
jgi:hypothetical protein